MQQTVNLCQVGSTPTPWTYYPIVLTPCFKWDIICYMVEFEVLSFERVQQVMQTRSLLGGASYTFPSEQLHELLRSGVLRDFVVITKPTRILTPSWYTVGVNRILTDIPDSVGICTSTCKHERPYYLFVGRREQNWSSKISDSPQRFAYELHPLGRELTDAEKNAIYDSM